MMIKLGVGKGQRTTKIMKQRNIKGSKFKQLSRTVPGMQCSEALEQHQEPIGTGAQRVRMAAILYFEEEDQFDELELALEKASGSYQEELKRSSAPVLPRPVNFAGAIMIVRELLNPSVSLHRHEIIRSEGNYFVWCMC